jgi:hypothetical protein
VDCGAWAGRKQGITGELGKTDTPASSELVPDREHAAKTFAKQEVERELSTALRAWSYSEISLAVFD